MVHPRDPAAEPGARELSCQVARQAVRAGTPGAEHVPLLVYSGIFRDEFSQEPAQAPYVQRALGDAAGQSTANPDGSFCLDMDRLMTAVEMADGAIRSRNLSAALVVAADCAVEFAEPQGVRLPDSASALLLKPSLDEGFVAFHTAVFGEFMELHQAHLRWTGEHHKHILTVIETPRFLPACLETAASTVHAFLEDVNLDLNPGLLVIPSQWPMGFPAGLASRLGLAPAQVVDLTTADDTPALTAGPLAALALARRDGRYQAAQDILFVTVEPGIVVSAALYRKPAGRI
ncbi:hypothetical protein [Stigmatella erecta]|uniref:hypothetical protein n=1 Tax=Stigmatella erecta TaxID=83460 RepID=UPI000B89D307|nr:hypothetical protein [Stigmatella erecta]